VRPPKMAIRSAIGVFVAAAVLALGAVSASAAPNPGFGTPLYPVGPGLFNAPPLANGFAQPIEQVEDGPQTANVPILAWVGEDVRLVACDDNILANPLGDLGIAFQQASWHTGLWTGDQAYQSTPTFDGSQSTNLYLTNTGSASFFFPTGVDNAAARPAKGCTSADISSLHAGLDEVGLDVTQQVAGIRTQLDPVPVYSQQFIVIWMTANKPTLTESSVHSLGFPTTAGSTGTVASPTDQLTPAVNLGTTAHPNWVGGHYNADQFLGDEGAPDTTNPLGTFNALDAWGADSPFNPSFFANNIFDPRNGNETPGANNGLVDIKVTGSFPIEDAPPSTTNAAYFGSQPGLVNNGTITLPDQWKNLATLMATSSTQYTSDGSTTGADLWDIHGGPTNTLAVDGHAGLAGGPLGVCQADGTKFLQPTDVVDDCVVGNPYAFSRVFGDVTSIGFTIGPYDSEDPNATLLSDGNINSDDAPMPALPVTVSIAKGGIGGLYGVSKWMIYSHDFDGGPASPLDLPDNPQESDGKTANLYNPYYQEYIPSTLRGFIPNGIQEASGVTGVYEGGFAASSGDDFPGFATGDTDAYTFWKALQVSTDDTYGSNGCLEYDETTAGFDGGQGSEFLNQAPPQVVPTTGRDPRVSTGLSYFATPYYPTSLMVYTDERGEAFVDYNPGTGFNTPPVTIDANGACDLQGLLGQPIGTATISAQAEYPYEAVPYVPPAGANTLTKTTLSQWSKTLTVLPKGNLSQAGSGSDINVVVAHAQNVNGTPFSDELVCVSSPPNETVTWLKPISTTVPPGPVVLGGFDITNSKDYIGNSVAPTDSACGYTSSFGNVAFDVSGSLSPTNVDIQGEFVPEHIFRDVVIPTLGQTGTVTSTTPPTVLPADKVVLQSGSDGSAGSSAGSSSSTGSATVPAASIIPSTPLAIGTGNSCKVNSVHLYAKKGYVQLKVSCTKSKTDSIVLRTIRSNGKVMRSYRKTITAGKSVRIYLSTRKVARVSVTA
jgi:hypothetical protein